MKQYTVYFELFGKKMKTIIIADSKKAAKEIICQSVIFHKVELSDDPIESLKKMFGFK